MDCSVVKTAIPGIYTVSTTDFFYPLVDEPYLQGRIAACNVVRARARGHGHGHGTCRSVGGACLDLLARRVGRPVGWSIGGVTA